MKVCLVSGEYPPMRGGVADYTAFLAAALARYDVETMIATSPKALLTPRLDAPRPDAPLSPRADDPRLAPTEILPIPDWSTRGARRLRELVEGNRPDVLHIQYQTGAFAMRPAINLLPIWLRTMRGRPRLAVTFHDLLVPYLFPKAGPIRNLANTLLIAGCDAVVTTNAEDAAQLAYPRRPRASDKSDDSPDPLTRAGRFGPPLHRIPIGSNIPVSPPNGYEREAWRARLNVSPDQILLSYFGFLAPSKGIDLLLSAVSELLQRGHNIKLAMVGGSSGDTNISDRPYERQIRALADAQTHRGRIIWTGFTGPEEVSANLLASDLCVLPFREGASLRHGTLVAAFVHGLPIITTEPPALPPLLDGIQLISGENCLLTTPKLESLVAAIEQAAGSPELRAHLAQGAERLGERFRWDTIARQSIRMYQEMLS